MKTVLFAVFLLALAAPVQAEVTIALETNGIVIATPGDGQFTLRYPSLVDGSDKQTYPTRATVTGNTASIEYPQGAKLALERNGAEMALHFSALPETASHFRMEMTLPGQFKSGGKWQLKGAAATPFPTDFAGEQFVFKGEPKPVTLTGPNGGAFTLAMPYGWHQILDGRKWNSPYFDFMFTTSVARGTENEAWFSFKLWAGAMEQEPAAPKANAAPAQAAQPAVREQTSLHLTGDGLSIEAGSAGHFTLNYPVLVGEKWDDVHKPIEKKVSGNTATLQFDGSTTITVAWQPADGTLTYTPLNVPASLKSLRSEMLIDFNYVNGGSWQIGQGKETPFPAQQPAQPHLFQGNADSLKLRNFEDATLTVQVPAYSYHQLTDNRQWGWKVFAWQLSTPWSAGSGPVQVKVALGAPSGNAKLVDRFGQSTRCDFPAKVKTEQELKEDLQTEAAWLASLQLPVLDRFGGLPGSGEKFGLKKTGFFHVEKKNQRWLLVDPDGNAFFHMGVCGFGPSDDYTYFAGRERVYEWLPEHDGEFATAFNPNAYWNPLALSFHLVNTIRKSGKPYDTATYTANMIERVRKWGFNSAGAFGAGDDATRRQKNFPHVAHLPLTTWDGFPEVPGTHGVFDPFSDKLRQQCDKVFAAKLPAAAADPLLIGYFLGNEPLWEEIPGAVAALDGSHPCKRRLASMLEEKYQTIDAFNRAWESSLTSFADVAARGLPVKTAAAKADMEQFTGLFLDAYFRLVTGTFHQYDPNHLLIGNRFQPGTINNETVCRLSGKYMDLVSFNYYAYGFDPALLARIRGWMGDRPMFFSEFYFSSPPDSGLTGGGKDVSSQRARGLAYRHYVEHAAALGYVVGIEWFTLVDQATTGRFFEKYNGEAANTGLISVADRPWKPLLEEMLKTNFDIYKVLFGERPPFVFDDLRFAGKQ